MVALILPASTIEAQDATRYTLESLSQLPACELERIYRQASPGAAPCGFMRGHVVFADGAALGRPRGRIANWLWDGKYFSDDALVNQFRGTRMIRAHVGAGESWLDGRPAHILDYQHTSIVWRNARDETREVAPGVYLGAMYLRRHHGSPHLKLFFILQACDCR
jgi:hypothetical protein